MVIVARTTISIFETEQLGSRSELGLYALFRTMNFLEQAKIIMPGKLNTKRLMENYRPQGWIHLFTSFGLGLISFFLVHAEFGLKQATSNMLVSQNKAVYMATWRNRCLSFFSLCNLNISKYKVCISNISMNKVLLFFTYKVSILLYLHVCFYV